MKTCTLEGLADQGEGGPLIADGGGVDEGLDGGGGAAGIVALENAPQHPRRLPPGEVGRPLRPILAAHPAVLGETPLRRGRRRRARRHGSQRRRGRHNRGSKSQRSQVLKQNGFIANPLKAHITKAVIPGNQ